MLDEAREPPQFPALALDLGARRVGVALSDELGLSVRTLPALARTNWKRLVRDLADLCIRFDVRMVVIGLPLRMDGTEGDAAIEARRAGTNLSRTLALPVRWQDERLTSFAAEELLREAGWSGRDLKARVDSEAAAIILRDFLAAETAKSVRVGTLEDRKTEREE